MAVKAVIDTNIWVSAILNPFGFPSKLLRSFEKGLFQPAISEPMFLELAEVLNRSRIKDKYRLTADDIKELLVLIEEHSEPVLLSGDVNICHDSNDNMVIETAVKGCVEYLVTRDEDIKHDRRVSSYLRKYSISVLFVAKFSSIIEK